MLSQAREQWIAIDRIQNARGFAIDADHLLVSRHDASLEGGATSAAAHDPSAHDAPSVEETVQPVGRRVLPAQGVQMGFDSEGGQIGGHVRRPTESLLLLPHVHHGNRSFGGDAIDATAHEAVEHAVAHHREAERVQASENGEPFLMSRSVEHCENPEKSGRTRDPRARDRGRRARPRGRICVPSGPVNATGGTA